MELKFDEIHEILRIFLDSESQEIHVELRGVRIHARKARHAVGPPVVAGDGAGCGTSPTVLQPSQPAVDSAAFRHLLDLLELAREADVEVLEVETGDFTVALRRNGEAPETDITVGGDPGGRRTRLPTITEDEVSTVRSAQGDAEPLASSVESVEVPDDCVAVPAPMVGVFYRCPEPGAAPFAEVGSALEAGSTLALIEVMKLFNAVTSSVDGVVESVLAADGEVVEYGQPLFLVRVAG